jgi:hypothetical protein
MNTAIINFMANHYAPLAIAIKKMTDEERKEYIEKMKNRPKLLENIKRFKERKNVNIPQSK